MRNLFINYLFKRAKKNKNVIILTGDLGYKYFDNFAKYFPDRFINTGIAENNMINLACGLALYNKEVYVYSIIPFLAFRSLEQIRNNIANLNLNVKIIGSGGGFSYGNQGVSHNPIEDIAIMRSIPNMNILNPGFEEEAKLSFKLLFNDKKPYYLRLGKKPSFNLSYKIDAKKYKKGDGILVKKGNEILLISTGNIIENVIKADEKLNEIGYSATLISCFSLKPINKYFYLKYLKESNIIITIEEHSEIGGLGTIISEMISEENVSYSKFEKISIQDKANIEIGSQEYLRNKSNLGVKTLTKKLLKILKNN